LLAWGAAALWPSVSPGSAAAARVAAAVQRRLYDARPAPTGSRTPDRRWEMAAARLLAARLRPHSPATAAVVERHGYGERTWRRSLRWSERCERCCERCCECWVSEMSDEDREVENCSSTNRLIIAAHRRRSSPRLRSRQDQSIARDGVAGNQASQMTQIHEHRMRSLLLLVC
jgi:hypothetical protein